MTDQELQATLDKMREYIQREVAAAFQEEEEIRTSVIDWMADKTKADELLPYAQQLTSEAMTAHFQGQLTWPTQTDCDRLDAAFAELERSGILARQNFSCCCNCGSQEIRDEMNNATQLGQMVRGYTFYHMQDTERAVEGRGVYLSFGSVEKGKEVFLEIGSAIVDTIQRHGLSVEWNGTVEKRILVHLDWKRRRSA